MEKTKGGEAKIYYEEKIRAICEVLDRMRERELCALQGFEYAPCAYKTANTPPADLEWRPFEAGTRLEGVDAHFWFRTGFDTPAAQEGKQIAFSLKTGREGQWDAENPQCIVYLNGALVQGMDVNHTQVLLEYGQHYDMQIYNPSCNADVLFYNFSASTLPDPVHK